MISSGSLHPITSPSYNARDPCERDGMSTILLQTKLFAPTPRADHVIRQRLHTRLDEGRGTALTLVSAPAGFGKSTLLSSWLALQEGPTSWLSLDEGDDDPVRFLRYVIAALQRLVAEDNRDEVGTTALSLLNAPVQSGFEPVFASLLNDLGGLEEPAVLVLDDYHVITNEAIHAGLAYFLDYCPAILRVIVASRGEPALPLARFRAGEEPPWRNRVESRWGR